MYKKLNVSLSISQGQAREAVRTLQNMLDASMVEYGVSCDDPEVRLADIFLNMLEREIG